MLQVRERIGSITLESARFSPEEARPGEDVTLTTLWSLQDLELETPQERDIRAFAVLTPAVPDPDVAPLAVVRWPLAATEHSALKSDMWTTKARLPVPSNIAEGPWKIQVGIERPRFKRDFVIRNGSQADQKSFVLRDSLQIGFPEWERFDADYPEGIRLEAGRILSGTPTAGSDLRFQLAWKARSATALLETGAHAFLFAHLFSIEDKQDAEVMNLPIFDRKQIVIGYPKIKKRSDLLFFETVRSGFTETYTFPLERTLLPGPYRLDFGIYLPSENKTEPAGLPTGSTTTTLRFPRRIFLKLPN